MNRFFGNENDDHDHDEFTCFFLFASLIVCNFVKNRLFELKLAKVLISIE